MKKLKTLFIAASLISGSSFACDLKQASDLALSTTMQIAKKYSSSKVGLTNLNSENGIALANIIIFNPSFNGVPLVTDLIGIVKIDLNTCLEIYSYAGTFVPVTFN